MVVMRKLTEVEKELVEKLRIIRNDKEFVIGVLSFLESDEERKHVLDFIQNKNDVTSDDVIYLVLSIRQT